MLRAALVSSLVSVLLLALPGLALAQWLREARRWSEVRTWFVDEGGLGLTSIALIGVAALGLGLAWVVGSWVARAVTDPVADLADQAEALGEGRSRTPAIRSGIVELDEVSGTLARSASQMNRDLAIERDFASDASHQLRTPLTAMAMRLDEIAATDDLATIHEEARLAMGQVERLTSTVDGLLARARGSAERPVVALDTLLATLQRDWQPQFAAARRAMRVEGERGLSVTGAPVALDQLFSALLENALTHGRGTVQVRVRRAGPTVVVEVSDEGEGVALALAPHIFERSVSSGGTGLGLALARDLAEAQGGRLELIAARPPVFAAFLSEAG